MKIVHSTVDETWRRLIDNGLQSLSNLAQNTLRTMHGKNKHAKLHHKNPIHNQDMKGVPRYIKEPQDNRSDHKHFIYDRDI